MIGYGRLKLPSTKHLDGFRTKKKLLIFNGTSENFPVCCERFLAYIEDKNLNVESLKLAKQTEMLFRGSCIMKSLCTSMMLVCR